MARCCDVLRRARSGEHNTRPFARLAQKWLPQLRYTLRIMQINQAPNQCYVRPEEKSMHVRKNRDPQLVVELKTHPLPISVPHCRVQSSKQIWLHMVTDIKPAVKQRLHMSQACLEKRRADRGTEL